LLSSIPRYRSVVVIEHLTFEVHADERAHWLAVEGETWSRFLERQPGFVRKEVWVERDDPHRIHALIWWSSEDQWKSIPLDDLTAVDTAMGHWFRQGACRTYDLVRDW